MAFAKSLSGPIPWYSRTGMADRSGGSFFHTCFSSPVSATSGAGSGVRAAAGAVGVGGRSVESPQAADPRHNPQVKAASTAADFIGARL